MKNKTNLAQPQITKILKTLESRNLIKSVKNVNNPSRKLYMLYELEPSREITGGAWWARMLADPAWHGRCSWTSCFSRAVPLWVNVMLQH